MSTSLLCVLQQLSLISDLEIILSQGGAIHVYWVEVKNAANHPTKSPCQELSKNHKTSAVRLPVDGALWGGCRVFRGTAVLEKVPRVERLGGLQPCTVSSPFCFLRVEGMILTSLSLLRLPCLPCRDGLFSL